MELQGRYDDIKRQGLGLVSITYDPPETLKKFADSRGITFPLISDPGSATIKRYGLFNDTVDPQTRETFSDDPCAPSSWPTCGISAASSRTRL